MAALPAGHGPGDLAQRRPGALAGRGRGAGAVPAASGSTGLLAGQAARRRPRARPGRPRPAARRDRRAPRRARARPVRRGGRRPLPARPATDLVRPRSTGAAPGRGSSRSPTRPAAARAPRLVALRAARAPLGRRSPTWLDEVLFVDDAHLRGVPRPGRRARRRSHEAIDAGRPRRRRPARAAGRRGRRRGPATAGRPAPDRRGRASDELGTTARRLRAGSRARRGCKVLVDAAATTPDAGPAAAEQLLAWLDRRDGGARVSGPGDPAARR